MAFKKNQLMFELIELCSFLLNEMPSNLGRLLTCRSVSRAFS